MVILKLKKPFQSSAVFVPHTSPFCFVAMVSFQGYTTPSVYDSSFDFTEPSLNDNVLEIAQVYIDNIEYEGVSTIDLMESTEKSFYFDFAGQLLYVHPPHTTRVGASDFDASKTQGYSSGHVFYDSNNVEYLPYLEDSITIESEADRLVYDKMGFVNNSVTLSNSDGEFDAYFDSAQQGSDASILFLSEEDRKAGKKVLTPVYTGFLEKDSGTKTSYTANLTDKRSQLNIDVPTELFTAEDYPDANSKTLGKAIPDGYGYRKGIKAYCLNGDSETGDVYYKYAQVGASLTQAYVKKDSVWTAVSVSASDPISGTFTLSEANGRNDRGTPLESKVNATLRDISNPADQIADMIERYTGRRFIEEYYNTTEWATEKAYLADATLYMQDQSELFEYIETIQNGTNYGFLFDIDANGKFTIKVDDNLREPSFTIQAIDNISDEGAWERDFTEYATSVRVNYNIDDESDESDYTINTDYKEATLDKYRYEKSLTYDSQLVSKEDAEEKAALIARDYSEARMSLTFTLDEISPIRIFDIGYIDGAIYSKLVQTRKYYGTRKVKVTGSVKDAGSEQTTITCYDITDIEEI